MAKDALFDRVAAFYDYEQKKFRQDIPFYLEYSQKSGGEVLEVACGTGRVMIPIAEAGIRITGLDTSSKMLAFAQQKIDRSGDKLKDNAQLVQGDMKNFNLDKKFNLILIAFRSFQCLVNKHEQETCLNNLRKHLEDDGRLIIDLFAPRHDYLAQGHLSIYLGTFYDETSNTTITRRTEATYDLAAQTVSNDWYYSWTDADGHFHQLLWKFTLGYLFRYEAELLFQKCGFRVEEIYGGFDKSPYNYYSGEQIFVLRKA